MAQQNKIVGIVGRKGSGKSTMLRKLLEPRERILVFDVLGEHAEWLPNKIYDFEKLDRFLGWAATQRTWAASFVPQVDLEGSFEFVSGRVYEMGNLAFAVEEIPMLCTPAHLPELFDRVVRLGRHRSIDLAYTGLRFAEIARRLTAATDVFLLFSQNEPRDLDALAERCGREVAERVGEIQQFESIAFEVLSRKVRKGDKFKPW